MKEEKQKQLDYLEEERKKLWQKVLELEEKLENDPNKSLSEIRQSSKKASEYRNRSEAAKNEILEKLESVALKNDEIQKYYESSISIQREIYSLFESSKEHETSIVEKSQELIGRLDQIEEKVEELEEIFEDETSLNEKVAKLQELLNTSTSNTSKLETAYRQVLSRKSEIDELYFDIIGYTETNPDTDEEVEIDGKKDELEKAYNKLKNDLDNYPKELQKFREDTISDYGLLVIEKDRDFTDRMGDYQKEYSNVLERIKQLLPDALTAGLSHAYSEKKKAEEGERKGHNKTFNGALIAMVLVSFIPFAFSVSQFDAGVSLQNIILNLPRLALSILPLYIPVLWLAYSSNKKMNLSKRLIEEYSHKEVLSKTYEGLSNQISNISDSEANNDLKIRLLYNILEVSSENPGKLISDYNKSDHPVMDALDKSVKLSNAVSKLSKLPGFSKLTSIVEQKSRKIISDEHIKAEDGLNRLSNN